ncbi:NAD(P)-binding domain-containing protein [Thalassomonas viridans]|uniref:NAD(P)-binding domain-containing protein n=1 Tax=Thalassomonas viridans TaxID=137584 RepID=A0AAF0CCH8_9GAMM|nr:NAD(P)-binding domain-containing protein [Thalassomonas viridans]WDE08473.1 NAD(P)-binding domain-containing protein [Thalassomonas viridans]
MQKIAIFGFGNVGQKLATLFSEAGKTVVIYSKDGQSGRDRYKSASYSDGVRAVDAIALAVPYTGIKALLKPLTEELAGKIIIDCSNPLNDDWSPLLLGQETSAAEQIAAAVPQAKVIKAFNTIFADVMAKEHHNRGGLTMTAFIAGDDSAAKNTTLELAAAVGLAPLDVGPLRSARYLEAMAHLNIQIAVGQGGGTQAAFVYHQA